MAEKKERHPPNPSSSILKSVGKAAEENAAAPTLLLLAAPCVAMSI